jgi:ribose-phosphate pyrophosphokinase
MIKINEEVVNINKFPDGTPKINIDTDYIAEQEYDGVSYIDIDWFYESNDELFYLLLVKKHLERHFTDVNYALHMPYIPNARMDRIKNDDEVFTLKYFCDFINSLNFSAVYVLDAHSDVSTALLNNCFKENLQEYIEAVITELPEDLVLYFPDAGAAKRYSDLFPELMYCYGEKNRDWKTGQILGLNVKTNGIDLTGKTILMIDDIISYGGTMAYSADKLKEMGAAEIYAYASHTENSILDKEKGTFLNRLNDNIINGLFTTNSIYNGSHPKIRVIHKF